jgi:hypothetical protein
LSNFSIAIPHYNRLCRLGHQSLYSDGVYQSERYQFCCWVCTSKSSLFYSSDLYRLVPLLWVSWQTFTAAFLEEMRLSSWYV